MGVDWFRNTTWDETIERAFDEKLRRARRKAQYLRVQAGPLARSHPEVALKLLDRYFELDDDFDDAQAHVDRATALLALGRVEEALRSYEAALARAWGGKKMTVSPNPARPSVYRIDKFIVPSAALSEFMDRVKNVQRILSTLPGCKQNLLLSQTGGPGEFNIVTVVEWADAEAVKNAKAHMDARYAQEGFDPQSFMKGLGIRGDLALYTEVAD